MIKKLKTNPCPKNIINLLSKPTGDVSLKNLNNDNKCPKYWKKISSFIEKAKIRGVKILELQKQAKSELLCVKFYLT